MALTFAFAGVEALAGWWSGSLALLGDAGHMATDSLSLGLAAFAAWLAKRPATHRHSYGMQRAEVLAGLINALLMLAVIVALAVASIQRLLVPQAVHGEAVAVVAVIGLIVNIVVALMLARGEQSFNVRGALLHVLGDLLGSVAALVAGIVIMLTGWTPIDPILTLTIAALILASTLRLLLETLHTLMEGVPRHLSLETIGRAIAARPGVSSVHDLHLWAVSSKQIALSAHLVIEDMQG
ncbi:MAG: cation diffusion facilitator family transporter, partial [Pseudomonadota bacterium]